MWSTQSKVWHYRLPYTYIGSPQISFGKEFSCNAGGLGSTSGLGRFPWRRKWQPTPVFLPGESHEQRSLAGYCPWGCKSWTQLSNYIRMNQVHIWGFPGDSVVRNTPVMQEPQRMWVWSLGREDLLEEGMATHSSILAWRIPWTEEPVKLSPWGRRVRHNWSDLAHTHACIHIYIYMCVCVCVCVCFMCMYIYTNIFIKGSLSWYCGIPCGQTYGLYTHLLPLYPLILWDAQC